ncbi:MAG: hypothetical protein A2583_05635 [Bdellovibrionales bacterium RIFOXYD1_FULL_53_11]|nr:MAG: hypothetical protein A2583_05635 [Bdellovibrionales bacterium RIFOXYD1_FULL_53_11]
MRDREFVVARNIKPGGDLMKETGKSLSVLLILLGFIGGAQAAKPPVDFDIDVVYGDDNRLDVFEITDNAQLRWADSTVSVFSASKLTTSDDGKTVVLKTGHHGRNTRLCTNERFYDQPDGAFCSGVLVGKDLVLTAGHCVESMFGCFMSKFVFGFSVKKQGDNPVSVPAGEVYSCREIVKREQDNHGADFAVIRLDRSVAGHEPLEINRSVQVENGTKIVLVGGPSGIPLKIASGARVIDNKKDKGFFVANTDSFHGNSGGPVINAYTGLIEGVLVRGEDDYVFDPALRCKRNRICKDDGSNCRGEDVTRASAFAPWIPALTAKPLF